MINAAFPQRLKAPEGSKRLALLTAVSPVPVITPDADMVKRFSVPAIKPSPSGPPAALLPKAPGPQEEALDSIKNSHGFIRI